ncbi:MULTISPECIES: YlbE-like family protein [unclassified Bacillus (in: firmicutes)]|uniref:YlbE-like family protein n=1 Tax=unclassified Bacillus (in: firmicutes) TaxID=185979 RepID=UPI0008E39E95|nr:MULTISPECIES: YlbE-like family protein [unclassified Bacillus (in: firmicutes)]SFA75917.1 YlbE-like protein [Bacillus sp. UNCCL13]SFQ65924.1 YlbE-like protein [Bacillus sp. cl95]
MRTDVMDYINQQKDLKDFIREQPQWYRKLMRNPHDLQAFEIAALNYHKKTIPHRVEKFTNGVQMASMMFHMFQAMNQQN